MAADDAPHLPHLTPDAFLHHCNTHYLRFNPGIVDAPKIDAFHAA